MVWGSMNLRAYMDAGYTPVVGCILTMAVAYVKQHFLGFTDNVTFQDGRFYAEGEGTKYYWEDDMLFVKE